MKIIIAPLATCCMVINAVHAEDFRPHFYAGIGAGLGYARDLESNAEELQRQAARSGISTEAEISDYSQAFKLLAGYRVNPVLGLEAQYAYLGKYSADIQGLNYRVNEHAEASAHGFGAAAMLFLPINQQAELFAKAGMFSSTFKARESTSGYRYNYNDTFSTRSTNPFVGVGLQIKSGNSSLRVEYESYEDVGKEDGEFDGSKVDLLMVSTQFRF